ncbi:LamG domain-containing protein [Thermococcus stetteri]|uniref:LamG domain-containing protein n=1 Tax=Thermococcus stetteri TaxID=49900 RepID=UPI001AE7625D|nr:LamG domain-containing protein [Thermococcus stetteri]MBP1912627.1 hypothetical protein [Thermococcus stetteri]
MDRARLLLVAIIIDIIAIGAVVTAIYLENSKGKSEDTYAKETPIEGVLKLYTTPTGPVKSINGTAVGNVTSQGKILHFDGSGYVDLSGAIGEVSDMRVGTISLVFRYEETDQNVLPILYFGDKEGKSLFIIEIGHRGLKNRRLYVTWIPEGNRPALCFDSGFNLKPGKWYHLVVVVSENGNTAYLNGREMTWRHYNFGNESMRLFFEDIPGKELFALGYGKTSDLITPEFLYFHGDIADLRIYPWPLSGSEVRELFQELRAGS